MTNVNDLAESIKGLGVLDLMTLRNQLQYDLGIAIPAITSVMNEKIQDEIPPFEEQTEFDVQLVAYGDRKIEVIKVVRELTGLGLKESKDLVESVPQIVKNSVSRDEKEAIKRRLESLGATVA